MGDIKTAVRDSGRKKWQDMWDKSEKGRNLFNYRPKVDYKVKHKFESRKGESIVSQLRTGYVKLNEYLQKSNITENDKCQCGEIESVKHFLLECEIYENEREKLRSNLFSCGITHFDMNVLLDLRPDDEFKEWRSSILEELETFVQIKGCAPPIYRVNIQVLSLYSRRPIPVWLYGFMAEYRQYRQSFVKNA